MRATTLVPGLLVLAACNGGNGGSSIRATPAPSLKSAPVLTLSESVDIGGVPFVRKGAEITVQLDIDAPEGFDEDASSVSFTGVPLSPSGPDTWSITLEGDEGEGVKTLDVVLVDDLGQQTRVSFEGDADVDPVQVGFDFTAPRANCLLSPANSNGEQEVTFTVLPTEPLINLVATPSDARIRLLDPVAVDDGDGTTWLVSFPDDDNIPSFTLDVSATDRVGNIPSPRQVGGQTLQGLCGLAGDGRLHGIFDLTPPSADLALALSAQGAIDRAGRLHLDPQGTGPVTASRCACCPTSPSTPT